MHLISDPRGVEKTVQSHGGLTRRSKLQGVDTFNFRATGS